MSWRWRAISLNLSTAISLPIDIRKFRSNHLTKHRKRLLACSQTRFQQMCWRSSFPTPSLWKGVRLFENMISSRYGSWARESLTVPFNVSPAGFALYTWQSLTSPFLLDTPLICPSLAWASVFNFSYFRSNRCLFNANCVKLMFLLLSKASYCCFKSTHFELC